MSKNQWITEQFEENRSQLRAIAYRMLGSMSEAEDAVQETWLRLSRSDTDTVNNLAGWLTTVTSRICLDILRVRRARREDPLDAEPSGQFQSKSFKNNPEQELLLADSIGLALLVILNTLNPAERLAFVLHDMFSVPFDEIAEITGRSEVSARQLASRARRRIKGKTNLRSSGFVRQRELVEAFYAAARRGNFDELLALLDPAVVLKTDREMLPVDAPTEVRGASDVAKNALAARSPFAEVAVVNGKSAIIVAPGGLLRLVLLFKITPENRIAKIDVVAKHKRLSQLEISTLPD